MISFITALIDTGAENSNVKNIKLQGKFCIQNIISTLMKMHFKVPYEVWVVLFITDFFLCLNKLNKQTLRFHV